MSLLGCLGSGSKTPNVVMNLLAEAQGQSPIRQTEGGMGLTSVFRLPTAAGRDPKLDTLAPQSAGVCLKDMIARPTVESFDDTLSLAVLHSQ